MFNRFAPQAESTERLLAEAYGFDPLAETWPDPGGYVDPPRGVNYDSPTNKFPSKTRNVITQLYDESVLKKLIEIANEQVRRFVFRNYRGPEGILDLKRTAITPRYHAGKPKGWPESVKDKSDDYLTISYMVSIPPTEEVVAKLNRFDPSEVEETQKSLLLAIKSVINTGLHLGSREQDWRMAEAMTCSPNHSRRLQVANLMTYLDVKKINFEGLDWNAVQNRLVKVRDKP